MGMRNRKPGRQTPTETQRTGLEEELLRRVRTPGTFSEAELYLLLDVIWCLMYFPEVPQKLKDVVSSLMDEAELQAGMELEKQDSDE